MKKRLQVSDDTITDVVSSSSLLDLQSRVNRDPFVVENVVSAEIIEITASRINERFTFLLD